MNRRLSALVRRDPAEVQGAYFLLKGLLPWLQPKRVTRLTGPIREGWLMKTVGGLAGTVGATLLSAHRHGRVTPELRKLGIWSALTLLVVDVSTYATHRKRRSAVFLADAAVQAALLAAQWYACSRMPVVIDARAGGLRDPSRYGAGEHGRWNILPGESRDAAGNRDIVAEGSMSSFPASDPPSYMG
ncbi:hypothetical protein HV824_18695 [Myxococcus sp. AM009]|uniref:hypothetical protein n=1 Tax=Myxococcus sp. AM009 TaxID=2745137 RepID=UPI001594EEA5|nr:hypothetical protein [Myxococcus sp. AM009]NVJ00140.1 hypothetical protein [Myxococcus sp. AM009]